MLLAWKKLVWETRETLVVEAMARQMDSISAEILSNQIAELNRVLRLDLVDGGQETILYRASGRFFKKPRWDDVPPLPWRAPELTLATGKCKSDRGEQVDFRVTTVFGYIGLIRFGRGWKACSSGSIALHLHLPGG